MDRNTRILLFAVLIILLALVALNFNSLTGKVLSNQKIDIDIQPSVIECGPYDRTKIVNIVVSPGVMGIDNTFSLYEVRNVKGKELWRRLGGSTDHLCRNAVCKGDISKNYKIPCDDFASGRYGFKFSRDNYHTELPSPLFTIKHIV